MSFIFSQNFSSIDDDHDEFSFLKEIGFKTKVKTLDNWISFNTYLNDMKCLSHIYIYSFMMYKILRLQIQKCSNKGDMTKKPYLSQKF
jgi:hypothetical protein